MIRDSSVNCFLHPHYSKRNSSRLIFNFNFSFELLRNMKRSRNYSNNLLLIFLRILIGIESVCGQNVVNCQMGYRGICDFKFKSIEKGEDVIFNAGNIYENEHTKGIKFQYSSIYAIPAKFFATFPRLEKLWLDGQEVEELIPRSFSRATELYFLDLGSNKFKELDDDIFEGAWQLQKLDLCCGEIENVHENALKSLVKLEYIVLCSNRIKKLHKNTFKNLPKLKEIDLYGNQLEFIHKDLFITNYKLEHLYLYGNKIKHMLSTAFTHLYRLDGLLLSQNQCIDKNYIAKAYLKYDEIEIDLRNCSKNYSPAEKVEEFNPYDRIFTEKNFILKDSLNNHLEQHRQTESL